MPVGESAREVDRLDIRAADRSGWPRQTQASSSAGDQIYGPPRDMDFSGFRQPRQHRFVTRIARPLNAPDRAIRSPNAQSFVARCRQRRELADGSDELVLDGELAGGHPDPLWRLT
jgi:hypothetical protein